MWEAIGARSGSGPCPSGQVDNDGNLLVAGNTYDSLDGHSNAGSWDIFVMSFTSTGSWRWTAQRGGTDDDTAAALEALLERA